MADVKHEPKHELKVESPPVKAKDLEPLKHAPKEPLRPAHPEKTETPRTLEQKLDAIHKRVEHAAHSRHADGKAEEFAACWDELDALGTDHGNPADAAMVQAAHNYLQHHAPRRASEIDSLETQLDAALKVQAKPEAKPDTPEVAHIKKRIADLHTDMANDPRALPGDKKKAQALQRKVDGITVEKATAGAK